MGKVTLEMDVNNEQLEELLGSYKAIEKLTYVTDDMCENFSYLSKAITANNREIKKLTANVAKLLEEIKNGDDTGGKGKEESS
jgi:cell division protein FtsB